MNHSGKLARGRLGQQSHKTNNRAHVSHGTITTIWLKMLSPGEGNGGRLEINVRISGDDRGGRVKDLKQLSGTSSCRSC